MGLSTAVLSLAGDLASFAGVPVAQTLDAITSALTGMTRPLRTLGIVIRQSDVEQRRLASAQRHGVDAASDAAAAYATLELITERAGAAVGDLSRTQDQAANVFRRVTATIGDTASAVGEFIRPAAVQFALALETALANIGATASVAAGGLTALAVATASRLIPALDLLVLRFRLALLSLAGPVGLIAVAAGAVVAFAGIASASVNTESAIDDLREAVEATNSEIDDLANFVAVGPQIPDIPLAGEIIAARGELQGLRSDLDDLDARRGVFSALDADALITFREQLVRDIEDAEQGIASATDRMNELADAADRADIAINRAFTDTDLDTIGDAFRSTRTEAERYLAQMETIGTAMANARTEAESLRAAMAAGLEGDRLDDANARLAELQTVLAQGADAAERIRDAVGAVGTIALPTVPSVDLSPPVALPPPPGYRSIDELGAEMADELRAAASAWIDVSESGGAAIEDGANRARDLLVSGGASVAAAIARGAGAGEIGAGLGQTAGGAAGFAFGGPVGQIIGTTAGAIIGGVIGGLFGGESEDERRRRAILESNNEALDRLREGLVDVNETIRGVSGRELAGVRTAALTALRTNVDRDPNAVFRTFQAQLQGLNLTLEDVRRVAELFGVTFTENTIGVRNVSEALRDFESQLFTTTQGRLDLVRQRAEVLDLSPEQQIQDLLGVLGEQLSGTLSEQVEALDFRGIIDAIAGGTIDFAELGDLSLDQFLAAISQLESLGDAANAAGDALGATANVLNAPRGFRAALAEYRAADPGGGDDRSTDTFTPLPLAPRPPSTRTGRLGDFSPPTPPTPRFDPNLITEAFTKGAESARDVLVQGLDRSFDDGMREIGVAMVPDVDALDAEIDRIRRTQLGITAGIDANTRPFDTAINRISRTRLGFTFGIGANTNPFDTAINRISRTRLGFTFGVDANTSPFDIAINRIRRTRLGFTFGIGANTRPFDIAINRIRQTRLGFTFGIGANTNPFDTAINRIRRTQLGITAGIDANTSPFDTAINRIRRTQLGITAGINANTSPFDTAINRLRLSRLGINVGLRPDTSDINRLFLHYFQHPLAIPVVLRPDTSQLDNIGLSGTAATTTINIQDGAITINEASDVDAVADAVIKKLRDQSRAGLNPLA